MGLDLKSNLGNFLLLRFLFFCYQKTHSIVRIHASANGNYMFYSFSIIATKFIQVGLQLGAINYLSDDELCLSGFKNHLNDAILSLRSLTCKL